MPRKVKPVSPSRRYMALCYDGKSRYFLKLTLPSYFKVNDATSAAAHVMQKTDAQIEQCISFEEYSSVVPLEELTKSMEMSV